MAPPARVTSSNDRVATHRQRVAIQGLWGSLCDHLVEGQVCLQRVVADVQDFAGPSLVPAAARQDEVNVAAAPRSERVVGLRLRPEDLSACMTEVIGKIGERDLGS